MISSALYKKILYGSIAFSLLTGCAVFEKKDTDQESNWLMQKFEKSGNKKADLATIAYSHGDFKKALEIVAESLKENPRNQQALLVGALSSEKLGRNNRARQYYEDLILINGKESSILGSSNGTPEKITEIARKRLRMIAIKQSELIIEDKGGSKVFNLSKEAGAEQSKNTINRAINKKPVSKASAAKPQIGSLFTPQEQNIISRFLILKELAEKDLITKEEFLSRRMSNAGGLLPLTNTPPATGIDSPVPSPDLIIERINVLKEAVETRAITPQEFSAERDVIIEALLPPSPRTRMKPKAPSKDILGAAKDLRKLEVLYDLNLITSAEKANEQKAIEKYLGINRAKTAVKPAQTTLQTTPEPLKSLEPQKLEIKTQVEEVLNPQAVPQLNTVEKVETVETITLPQEMQKELSGNIEVKPAPVSPAPQNIIPNVSSPF